ncbi:uncharacterized protein K441DRAFT_707696 [Cenococcum geophilum 1.58]|uniref:uncharacterized protein n=1 Tax=Cenococcum geophilum 1.58 TaxID=794803 RepID=UPI00358F0890|nr:hypothetical protein K441DRAFT_707696 [Cenococcum geophilum 1.58]
MPLPPVQSDLLAPFLIPSLPPSFYYIPNFITPEEEASILRKIPPNRWTSLSYRRLQAIPSTLTKSNTLLAAPFPAYLADPIIPRFSALGVFATTPHGAPNHILINEYKAGEGIMPHEDGAAYAPVVATVSLNASICLEANASRVSLPARILQEPRSLLLTTGAAYSDLLHSISPVDVDADLGAATVANWGLLGDESVFEKVGGINQRGTRVSLTYRDVLKVSSAAGKVLGGLRKG